MGVMYNFHTCLTGLAPSLLFSWSGSLAERAGSYCFFVSPSVRFVQFFGNCSLSSFFWQGTPFKWQLQLPSSSDLFLLLNKMLRIWFLGFTAICCQFTAYYLVPMSYWGRLAGLCSKLSSDSLLKKTGYRASEAYPLKDFAGERLSTLCQKLLRLFTEEGRVPWTGNHPCIILRKIDGSFLGSFSGSLRRKNELLTPEASHCNMKTNFYRYIPT